MRKCHKCSNERNFWNVHSCMHQSWHIKSYPDIFCLACEHLWAVVLKETGLHKICRIHTWELSFEYRVTAENWIFGNCDCCNGFKLFVCEHMIGIALRLKVASAPPLLLVFALAPPVLLDHPDWPKKKTRQTKKIETSISVPMNKKSDRNLTLDSWSQKTAR